MSEIPFNQLSGILVFLVFPLIGGLIASRYKASPITGYIIGGILLHFFFADRLPKDFINNFSMSGLVLLIFTLGLETNLNYLKRFGKFVIFAGLLQIVLSAAFIFFLAILFNFALLESVIIAFAFALSSTAVV